MFTEQSRQQDFPALSGITYLNTAAESIPPKCVGEALNQYSEDKLRGMKGRDSHFAQVEACREISARHLGLKTSEIGFCSCSSEAYNLLASALELDSAAEVVVNNLDFPAGVTPWLRAKTPPVLKLWEANEGSLVLSDLRALLNERTKLVQLSLVSFYNGHRIQWSAFRDLVREIAPNALIAVDLTQALGRISPDWAGADILISSTHKWTLGVHGGCIIGIPEHASERLTTRAGGWLHIHNAFDENRFHVACAKTGAASFSVGMPNFAALYALNASLRYLEQVGVAQIEAHSNPLAATAESGIRSIGINPLCVWDATNPTGIVAFKHHRSVELHAALEQEGIHVMHNAGRIRIAVHGYNTASDIQRFLKVLATLI